ncbi:diguanylate cyclase [Sulfuritalea sp.]|uniref:sensor domain-containing diguanylate cyclase n=1 Tax=Sulfuritalea sp. TaxID=2480090 RepID=UPI00286D836F|nr:diguanylate cyclase [Sulfuritalea sp.]
MIHFRRIGHRLLASVGGIVILGIVAIALTYAIRQEASSLQQAENALGKVTDSVAEGLAAIMLGGHAKAAPDFASRLKNVPNVVDYRIIRIDGTQAFVDNATVEQVNARLGEFEFTGRKGEPAPVRAVSSIDPALERMRQTGERVFSYHTQPGGERLVTVFSPIHAGLSCKKCHGAEAALRGAITLTVSMKEIDDDVEHTWRLSILVIIGALAGIITLIYWFAHRTVVSQIVEFLKAMETAAVGDNSVRLKATSRDEIGRMARSFNHMNEELLQIYGNLKEERAKLNTVIHGASSGIVVTDALQHVVLVNRAAENIIGRSEQAIIEGGFLHLFDDSAWMEARIQNEGGEASSPLLEWNGKILSVQASTIRHEGGTIIGSAALIRDITEEKRLEARLKEQSITDALTDLHNRRHFDEVLVTEYKRWKRYAQPLSVMMIDVDHFKKFNDTHGHDCGDRVLSAIGAVLKTLAAPSLIPCRYGGEEMLIVMPGVVEERGVQLAETVRQRISELVIDGLKVTVSIGVAGVPGHEVENGDALVKLADDALYDAKEGGRNQVRRAGPRSAGYLGADTQ